MNTQTNDIDLVAEAAKPPVQAAAKKPAAKKPAAKKPAAKKTAKPNGKSPEQIAADKAKADEAKAKRDAAAKAKHEADKAREEKQLVVSTEKKCKPLIDAGVKAINMVGKGNREWTIAAFQIREACKGTSVNFKDVMENGWGVAKNTATKLANAGELMHAITSSEDEEVQNQIKYLPMGSINNLSTISTFSDKKFEVGIDLGVIKMDATEADISAFNREYDDKGNRVIEGTSTPAGEADTGEDEDAAPTPAAKPAPISAAAFLQDCATVALSSEEVQQAVITLLKDHDSDTVIEIIEALEAAHGITPAE